MRYIKCDRCHLIKSDEANNSHTINATSLTGRKQYHRDLCTNCVETVANVFNEVLPRDKESLC